MIVLIIQLIIFQETAKLQILFQNNTSQPIFLQISTFLQFIQLSQFKLINTIQFLVLIYNVNQFCL